MAEQKLTYANTEPVASDVIGGPSGFATLFSPDTSVYHNGLGGGMVAVSGADIVAAVRHSSFIPSTVTHEGVEYHGPQTIEIIEHSKQRVVGMSAAAEVASRFINYLTHRDLRTTTVHKTRAGQIGNERETWAFDSSGKPYELPKDIAHQSELQSNLWETDTSPHALAQEQAVALALDIVRRLSDPDVAEGTILNDTSVPIISRPEELGLNSNEGAIGDYVKAVQYKFFTEIFDPVDEHAKALWNDLAHELGYEDFEDMKTQVGSFTLWANAAAQASVGLYRVRSVEDGKTYIPTETAIAVSDLVNSNFGNVLEWMTYSTPIIFGKRPGVNYEDEGKKYPKDQRALIRLACWTAYPSDFIGDTHTLAERVQDNIIHGVSDRLDRASYHAVIQKDGETIKVGAAHSRVRNRITQDRIEFTGGGSTPDMIAAISRNAMLQLMTIYAYEGLATGQYPMDYQGGQFPSMATTENQLQLSHDFNFGNDSRAVEDVLLEADEFVKYMKARYKGPQMQYLCDAAQLGVRRLTEQTEANDLKEFLDNPKGNISDVIVKMYERGVDPLDIAHEIHRFQAAQAKKILEVNGNILQLVA